MESVILTPREVVFPEITTLDSEILEAYKEKISSYGPKARISLDIFSNKNGDLAGSNCFAPIVLRDLLPENSRLATMADLGWATEISPEFLKESYSDTGLVLRTAGDSYEDNNLLAKNLASQLKKIRISLKHPKVIYFDALDLEEEKDSAYGLVYRLNERAELGKNIINVPELRYNFKFKTMDKRGIPIRDKEGNRIYFTRKKGLSMFGLQFVAIDSGGGELAYSRCGGRVTVVNNESITNKK